MHQIIDDGHSYRIGVAYWDWPMGASPWYQEDGVTERTLSDAMAECRIRNHEVAQEEQDPCNYPVWSFRRIYYADDRPHYEHMRCNQETGQPVERHVHNFGQLG